MCIRDRAHAVQRRHGHGELVRACLGLGVGQLGGSGRSLSLGSSQAERTDGGVSCLLYTSGAVLTQPILREDYTQLRHFLRLALRWATERYALSLIHIYPNFL